MRYTPGYHSPHLDDLVPRAEVDSANQRREMAFTLFHNFVAAVLPQHVRERWKDDFAILFDAAKHECWRIKNLELDWKQAQADRARVAALEGALQDARDYPCDPYVRERIDALLAQADAQPNPEPTRPASDAVPATGGDGLGSGG